MVPVTGAGLSIPLGYPSAPDLLAHLVALGRNAGIADELLANRDPRNVADVLIEEQAIDRGELLARVGALYERAPTGSSRTIDALLRASSKLIVTLNYDPALEVIAGKLGIECDPIVLSQDPVAALTALDASTPRDRLVVVHAHAASHRLRRCHLGSAA